VLGGCIAFRTHLALGNDTRSDPGATISAPSRRDRDHASVNREPRFVENARPYPSLLAMGTLASG
jgi:hypothetical protein